MKQYNDVELYALGMVVTVVEILKNSGYAVEKAEHSESEAGPSPSNSLQMTNISQVEQNMREQWEATCIQTAFREVLFVLGSPMLGKRYVGEEEGRRSTPCK